MMQYEAKAAKLGLDLGAVSSDDARYLSATRSGLLVFTSGQVAKDGDRSIRGKVGATVSLIMARDAARLCTLNCLRAIRSVVGSLDHVARIVKVFGMVNVAPDFDETREVIDACSELLIDIFGEAGRHVRTATGTAIPNNYAVEIEVVAELRPDWEFRMYDFP